MFQVEVVSPEAVSYTGEAEMVIARTVGGGDIAFQTGHVPFIGQQPGLSVHDDVGDITMPAADYRHAGCRHFDQCHRRAAFGVAIRGGHTGGKEHMVLPGEANHLAV